jgi:hypothetical protein
MGIRAAFGLLVALLLVTVAALAATLFVSTQGYRALTREEVAAVVRTEPAGGQRFIASLELPDGRAQTFRLAGDQVYIDARILKWKPLANLIGLHTAYELDRIAGRYRELEDERTKDRTVFPLAAGFPSWGRWSTPSTARRASSPPVSPRPTSCASRRAAS